MGDLGRGTQYTYDDDGMLLTSSDGATYAYDAAGQRAVVSNGSGTTEYYYFGGRLMASLNPASDAWTDMIYAGGMRIATVAGTASATPIYALLDHIGSEVATVDSSGHQLSALDYTPFGQMISGTAGSDGHLFTDLLRDNDGLDHAMFRQYSSTTGRWTVPDPYDGSYNYGDPQSLNRYAYALTNPVNFVDPSGLCSNGNDNVGGGTMYDSYGNYISSFSGGSCSNWLDHLGSFLKDLFGFGPSKFNGNVNAAGQGKNTRSTSKDPCANDTLAKAGVDARQQIAQAQGAMLNSSGPFGDLSAYAGTVGTGGPNDIKNLPGHSPQNPIDVAAGNISYGITCSFGQRFCQFVAGLAQTLAGDPNFKGSLRTGFDTPADNAPIRMGQAMRAAGCHE